VLRCRLSALRTPRNPARPAQEEHMATATQTGLLALVVGALGFVAGAGLGPLPRWGPGAVNDTAVTEANDPENRVVAALQQRLARALAPFDSIALDSLASADFLSVNAAGQAIERANVPQI
jgi:preprotein translocase subunit Sss1